MTIGIDYYSDALCIWAYIAQRRGSELEAEFTGDIRIDYRFLQVFGDVQGKMATQWSDRGGLAGYAAHVQEVAAGFEHVDINPDVWLANTPASSLPAHLILCGTRLCAADKVPVLLAILRQAFFVDLVDVSNTGGLLKLAEQAGIDTAKLTQTIDSGEAHAQLAADLGAATQNGVRSSPTMIFNEGRQMLSGNVGYRVMEANVRELLRQPGDQQSWC